MIVDIILVLLALGAVVAGYRRGFLHTFFATVGYIGGGVLGLVLSLHFIANVHSSVSRIGLTILAIFLMAELGRRILGSGATFFRARILWAPFRFIDSLAGLVLEVIRVAILTYLLIAIILWSPWASAREAIAKSTLYPKLAAEMPRVFHQLRADIEKKFAINRGDFFTG